MFIITNREVDESRNDVHAFGPKPNALGPNELRMAEAVRKQGKWYITILPDQITKAMADEAGLVPELDTSTGEAKPIYASRYIARRLLANVNPAALGKKNVTGRNFVFFVHGFNNDVEAVLDRAEVFSKLYDVEVLAFTWPANGGGVEGVASYKSDKRDAQASVVALDRCLAKIDGYLQDIHAEHVKNVEAEADRRFPDDAEKWDRCFASSADKWCPFSVNLVLHTMGNCLYKHLFSSSVYRNNLLIFDNVLLASADTNNEGHAVWVDRIQCRNRIYVTINEKDSALNASRLKLGEEQKARLGHYPFNLNAKHAIYVNFTGESYVGSSHAYFEGTAVTKNAKIKRFFTEVLNGENAESRLDYDMAWNLYRFR